MIVLSAIMTACYEDKGNYDYIDLPEIKIEAKDTLYVMQFTTLELPVDIELQGNATESDYDFSWRIWANDALGVYNQKKDICLTKDLKYEVTEMPGSYTLVLTCHNRNTGVDTYKNFNLTGQSSKTQRQRCCHIRISLWRTLSGSCYCHRCRRRASGCGNNAENVRLVDAFDLDGQLQT